MPVLAVKLGRANSAYAARACRFRYAGVTGTRLDDSYPTAVTDAVAAAG